MYSKPLAVLSIVVWTELRRHGNSMQHKMLINTMDLIEQKFSIPTLRETSSYGLR